MFGQQVSNKPQSLQEHLPRLIAWEVTRCCMLACKHCRAAAQPTPYEDELTTEECFRLMDNISSFARPIIILTGGEPMLRNDIYKIASHATKLGLTAVMATCGMLLDDTSVAKIIASGIRTISISLDGAMAQSHDAFRGVAGAFAGALHGIEAAKRAGLEFQINTTVTKHNLAELPAILNLSVRLGAKTFNPFLLVPIGRGKELADQEITPQQYEETLRWLAGEQNRKDIQIRVTCAPHYQRILQQSGRRRPGNPVRGCMGGQSFAFISHVGKVQICGFLEVECGDVRKEGFDFRKIWETSEVFRRLRQQANYRGRCSWCEFHKICGGCRARAYAMTGDWLAEEPFCLYQPKRSASPADKTHQPSTDVSNDGLLDLLDRRLLSIIQSGLPAAQRPYDILAGKLGTTADEALCRVNRLRDSGIIRRLGAVFDSRKLGVFSTLVAARVPADRLDEVAAAVNELPGVTHNYSRRHEWNLWFTLTARNAGEIKVQLAQLSGRAGIADIHALPAEKVYKIRVDFKLMNSSDDSINSPQPPTTFSDKAAEMLDNFTPDQQALIRLLQEDLPRAEEPFAALAGKLNWPVEEVIRQVRDWLASGVIRRFGAVVRHRQIGFSANAMAVFNAPLDRIDEIGSALAGLSEVSHCYRRQPFPGFDYNLFAMFHSRSEKHLRDKITNTARQFSLQCYDILFSEKEYKKTSPKFL